MDLLVDVIKQNMKDSYFSRYFNYCPEKIDFETKNKDVISTMIFLSPANVAHTYGRQYNDLVNKILEEAAAVKKRH